MPHWLIQAAGWTSLVIGGLSLWTGVSLLLRDGAPSRDSTGTPGWLVLAERTGLVLLGSALLLGGDWTHLIRPAIILLTVNAALALRRRWAAPAGRRS